MLHACVQRFDVTENLKILAKFLAPKRCQGRNLPVQGFADNHGSSTCIRSTCRTSPQQAKPLHEPRHVFQTCIPGRGRQARQPSARSRSTGAINVVIAWQGKSRHTSPAVNPNHATSPEHASEFSDTESLSSTEQQSSSSSSI
jgi:hypothetical protein